MRLNKAANDYFWAQFRDEELLDLRIRDLGLQVESTDLILKVQRILQDLHEAGLQISPRIYFGDEWFSPEDTIAVAVPFFLAHPRLRELEKKMMFECEGETEKDFNKLFRHELGHVFDHAFRVSKRPKWKKLFGDNRKEYEPETYRPRPYSKNYVRNISHWYAQSHPDEDFAETFAVWLDPTSNWQTAYQKWGAYRKLQYIDKLAKEFKGREVKPSKGRMISDARHLSSTLRRYYSKRQKDAAEDYPDFYDRDLLRIFGVQEDLSKHHLTAEQFMKDNRKLIVSTIARWTGEKKVTINDLVSKLIKRLKNLNLFVTKDPSETSMELSAFLATLVSNYLFTGHFKRAP